MDNRDIEEVPDGQPQEILDAGRVRTRRLVNAVIPVGLALVGVNIQLLRGSAVPDTQQLLALTILVPCAIFALTLAGGLGVLASRAWDVGAKVRGAILGAPAFILTTIGVSVFIQALVRAARAFDQRFFIDW